MTLFLKQSTSIDIRIGPFVDATDAVTPETGITLAGADQAEVLKANGAATVAMAGTFAAITGADGWYDYTVATGDVDTVGEVMFVVQDLSVCLPVFVRGYVVEEAIFDAIYAASAEGFDANGRVDVGSWLGTAVATPTVAGVPEVDITHVEGATTLSELSVAAPSATPSLSACLMLLYMALRNKLDVTTSIKEVHNNAGTIIATKALTDSGSVYSEAEMISG